MRKTLHDTDDAFFTFRDGKIHIWDSQVVDVFIEAANKGLELLKKMRLAYREIDVVDPNSPHAHEIPEAFRKVRGFAGIPSITDEESFCVCVNDWVCKYVNNECSATDEMIDELNVFMSKVRYRHMLMPSKTGSPYWEYIADLDRHFDPSESAAFGFSQMLTIGALAKVKRCENDDCGHYFLGRSNAKWCTKTCGNNFRSKEKRKRDL